jgi:pentapeptide MXKDX repeat protein
MLGFFPVNLCDLRLGFPRLPCNSPHCSSDVCPQVRTLLPAKSELHSPNFIQGDTMKKIFSSLTLACVLAASLAAFAQDQMKQDDMKKDDAKPDTMKSDSMKKDKKSKKAAKKDAMKKDEMKKDETKNN